MSIPKIFAISKLRTKHAHCQGHKFKISCTFQIERQNWPEKGSVIYSLRVLFTSKNQITPSKEPWSCLIFWLTCHTMLINEFYNCQCICSIGKKLMVNNIIAVECIELSINFNKTDSIPVMLFSLRRLFKHSYCELQNHVTYLMMSETYYQLYSITCQLAWENLADQE